MVPLRNNNRQDLQKMKKIIKESLISALLFFCIFYATLQVDWMKTFHLHPTIVGDKLSEWVWKLSESSLWKVNNRDVCEPIDSLMNEMCRANNISTSDIHVVINRDNEVNAFATVGNHLIINTALIKKMENESQLCAVIAHEMAHLRLGHIQSAVRQQAVITVLLTLITGNGQSEMLANLTSNMISNSITRAKENEADAQGARYMHTMHLDPMEMANTLETFESYGILSYLMDHADSKKRAERIRKMHFSNNGPYRKILSQETWDKIKQACQ